MTNPSEHAHLSHGETVQANSSSLSSDGPYGGTYTENDTIDPHDYHDNEVLLDSLGENSASYLARLTAVACLGGLQFGWDTGIASGMLVAIRNDLGHQLTEGEQELIVSATTLGAIFGSIVAGRMAGWLGRKKVMIASGIFFLLGSLEQAASQVVRELVLGRFLVGLGVGMTSMVVPTYLAEVAPTSVRGRVVGINSLLVTGGQVIAYIVDATFYNVSHGWRWMVIAGGIPAIVQLVGLFYLDESPRWLLSKGRIIGARHVLQRMYPKAALKDIDREIDAIQQSMQRFVSASSQPVTGEYHDDAEQPQQQQEESADGRGHSFFPLRHTAAVTNAASTSKAKLDETTNKLKLLWTDRNNRKALILACGLQLFQQLVSFNALMYFSSRLLLMAGFVSNPNAAAIGIAVANFFGTIVAMRYLDTLGRRKLLLWTTAAMTLSLALLSFSFSKIDMGPTSGGSEPPSLSSTSQSSMAWSYLCLVFMILFTLNYALGMGIIPWLVQSEVFTDPVRGVGAGLATATNWSANLVISSTFLHLVKWIKAEGSFAIFTIISALSWWFTYTRLPEMKGINLSQVHRSFETFPVTPASSEYHRLKTEQEGDDDVQV